MMMGGKWCRKARSFRDAGDDGYEHSLEDKFGHRRTLFKACCEGRFDQVRNGQTWQL